MQPFSRVKVDYAVQGGARVWWEIDRHFIDPGTYTFQLQVGHTGLSAADDWIDVGSPVVDTYMAFDTEKRLFGKTLDVHYKVKLTTTNGIYYSIPVPSDGLLAKRDWLKFREIARKEQLRHRVQTSINGFLLKARRYGPKCNYCADQFTDEISLTNCSHCKGTGFLHGYFAPLAASYADLTLNATREHRSPEVGMTKESVITARFIGDPQLYSYDVWCDAYTDERYYMHNITEKAHVRGVTLIYDVELRVAPFTDIIYTVQLPGHTLPQLKPEIKETKPCSTAPRTRGLNYLEAAMAELRDQRKRSSRR